MKSFVALSLLCAVFTPNALAHLPSDVHLRVLFVRHGEKPEDEKNYNLSCKGYNRSTALPKAILSSFGTPSALYVSKMKLGEATSSARMYQTAIPFAVQTGLQINTSFAQEDHGSIANELASKSGTVLVIWEHKNIAPIVRQLGVSDEQLKWHREDFDSIWIVDFKKDGLGKLHPEFNTSRENILPSPNCPF